MHILSATVLGAFAKWLAEEYKIACRFFPPAKPTGFNDGNAHPTLHTSLLYPLPKGLIKCKYFKGPHVPAMSSLSQLKTPAIGPRLPPHTALGPPSGFTSHHPVGAFHVQA